MNSIAVPTKIIFHYFNFPGRGEASRIALRFANIAFGDRRISFSDWKNVKSSFQPWEHLPILEADDVTVFHSINILQYIGRFTGLIPSTAAEEFKMNEILCACEDVVAAISSIGPFEDQEKKLEARRALCVPGGAVHKIVSKFDRFLGDRSFVAADKFTIGDAALFAMLCSLTSGTFDGFPTTMLDDFPRLKTYRSRIASIPQVAKAYESETQSWGAAFRP